MHVKAIQLIPFGTFTFPNPVSIPASSCTQGCWGQLEYMGHRKTKDTPCVQKTQQRLMQP